MYPLVFIIAVPYFLAATFPAGEIINLDSLAKVFSKNHTARKSSMESAQAISCV
jgi:hypothetical protein